MHVAESVVKYISEHGRARGRTCCRTFGRAPIRISEKTASIICGKLSGRTYIRTVTVNVAVHVAECITIGVGWQMYFFYH
jgi:hypothetical protein